VIVTDTNLIVHLTVRGEFSALAEAVYAADAAWIAPLLWRSEYRNTLMKYVQHRGMTIESALLSMRSAEEAVEHSYDVSSEKVLELAMQSKCSAYDCEYVALAMDSGMPLVTTDKQVLRAFPKIAVSMGKFVK